MMNMNGVETVTQPQSGQYVKQYNRVTPTRQADTKALIRINTVGKKIPHPLWQTK